MSYYKLLKIPETSNPDEILEGYKKQRDKLLKLDLDGSIKQSKLRQLDEALDNLVDPDSRQIYDEKLFSDGDQSNRSIYGAKLFDYSSFRKTNKVSWQSFTNSSNPVLQLQSLLENVLYLPNPDVQLKFLLCGILAPSALCDTLPLLFCFGQEGSGKSLICKITAKFWNTTILTSATTTVGLRNNIHSAKWGMFEGHTIERNCGIVFNDLARNQLSSNPTLIAFLKAYSREESIIQISSPEKDGTNIEFDIFSNRMISSVTPFFALSDFKEIARRILAINCVRASSDCNLVPFSDIDFSGASMVIPNLWESAETCQKFATLNLRQSFNKLGKSVSIDRFDTLKNLLAVGVILGIFVNPDVAIEYLVESEKLYSELKLDHGDKLKGILRLYCKARLKEQDKLGMPRTIAPILIKNYAQKCSREGKIDEFPKQGKIDKIMGELGYVYDRKLHNWREHD